MLFQKICSTNEKTKYWFLASLPVITIWHIHLLQSHRHILQWPYQIILTTIHLRFWYILRCIIEVSYICTKIREFCRRLRTMLQREQIKTWITRDQGVWGNMLQKRKSCINVCYSSKTNNKLPVTLSPRYCPFHKTLPRSSAFVNWISVRFYETDC